jgi:lipoprotein-releasing system permease protein
MNASFFIAKRYLFSKKKKNFINIISTISVGGVAVGTMALVIVMAVFNGLQDFTMTLYASHNPEIRIVAKEGKSFEVTDSLLSQIKQIAGVKMLTEVIEDNAFVNYGENQMAVNVKGVSDNFVEQYQIGDTQLISGKLLVKKIDDEGISTAYALIGVGVQIQLGVTIQDDMKPLMFLYPRKQKKVSLDMNTAITRKAILPAGVLSIDPYFDNINVLVPIEFAEELMLYGSRRTSLEVKTDNPVLINKVQEELKKLLGSQFSIKNREEQQESVLRATRIERLFVFITFALILGVASINIFFSLAMLAIEKQKDIAVLFAMGANKKFVRQLFLAEGSLIALIGTLIGIIGGLSICFIQQIFEIILLGPTQAYPVKVVWTDLIYIAITIIVITFLASYAPARNAAKVKMSEQL